MTISSALLIALLFGFAAILFRQGVQRKTLGSRLANLAPGAPIVAQLPKISGSRVSRLSKSRKFQIDAELPDLIELLASSVLASASMHASIERISSRAHGIVAGELQLMLRRLELGSRFDAELAALCERLPTSGIREFANKISIAMARGTPLAGALVALSETLRARHSTALLAKAGANETKMLIPLVTLVLPTTVLFAVYPSVQFLNIGFN